jgi:hypothetical protein
MCPIFRICRVKGEILNSAYPIFMLRFVTFSSASASTSQYKTNRSGEA